MADYYPLVSRAVTALAPNTFDRRRALYDRVRTAQASQLGKLDPPDNSVIAREHQALEKAISIIEAVAIATEHAENDFEIVSAYATFCEQSTTRPDCFYDASALPYPKHAIVAALERQIVLEPTDIRAEWLQTGPAFLWHFLDGVGSVPVPLISSNLKQLKQDNATPEQFREEAKRISASYERSEPFVAVARQEADRVEQRINAALQIRRERLAIDKDFDREPVRLNAAINPAELSALAQKRKEEITTGAIMGAPEELQGRKGSMLAARILTPVVLAMIYGVYDFIARGVSSDFYLYTYVPVLGGVAATTGLMAYYSRVASPNFAKISWENSLVFLGFLPYLFLTYVIAFFGLYAIYRGVIVSFSVWTILAGIFWVAIGYRGIDQFYLMTKIVEKHSKIHPPIRH